jgi:hypothetical protein
MEEKRGSMLSDREGRLSSQINLRSLLTYQLDDGIGHTVASLDGCGGERLSHRGSVCSRLGEDVIEPGVQSTQVAVGEPYGCRRETTRPRRPRANTSVMAELYLLLGEATQFSNINPIMGCDVLVYWRELPGPALAPGRICPLDWVTDRGPTGQLARTAGVMFPARPARRSGRRQSSSRTSKNVLTAALRSRGSQRPPSSILRMGLRTRIACRVMISSRAWRMRARLPTLAALIPMTPTIRPWAGARRCSVPDVPWPRHAERPACRPHRATPASGSRPPRQRLGGLPHAEDRRNHCRSERT